MPLDRGLLEGGDGEGVVIDFVALLAPRPAAGIRASVGEREGGIAPECGKQRQVLLLCPLEGVVGANVSVEYHRGQRDYPGEPVPQGLEHGGETHALRCGRAVRCGGVLAALGTPWTTLDGGSRWLVLGGALRLGGGLRGVAADNLLDTSWKRAPWLEADARQGEEGQSGHRLAIPTGKEAIQAMGMVARFGGANFIPDPQGDILGTGHMLTKDQPKQGGPREHGGEQTLDGPGTAALAGPAREPQRSSAKVTL